MKCWLCENQGACEVHDPELFERMPMSTSSFVCYKCGVRVPGNEKLELFDYHDVEVEAECMEFCSWKCLSNYANNVVSP